MIKLGLATIAFHDRPLEYALEAAGGMGFNGVEIWGQEPHLSALYDPVNVARVRDAADEKGLEIPVLGSYVCFAGNGEVSDQQLTEVLSTAEHLGTPLIRIWAGRKSSAEAGKDEMKNCARDMKEFAKQASDKGKALAVELHDHTYVDRIRSIAMLLEMVDEPNLGLNFQVCFNPRRDEPIEVINAFAKHVLNVHAVNFRTFGERLSVKDDLTPLAQGIVDYGKIIAALKEVGFDGYVEVEHLRPELPLDQLRQDYAFLKEHI